VLTVCSAPGTHGVDDLTNLSEHEAGLRVLDVVTAAVGDDEIGSGFQRCEVSLEMPPHSFGDPSNRSWRAFRDPVADDPARTRPLRVTSAPMSPALFSEPGKARSRG
jgi:hypothetical protein